MYFWASVIVVLVLMCVVGWRIDHKHKGSHVSTRPRDAVDARGDEVLGTHRNLGGISGGGPV